MHVYCLRLYTENGIAKSWKLNPYSVDKALSKKHHKNFYMYIKKIFDYSPHNDENILRHEELNHLTRIMRRLTSFHLSLFQFSNNILRAL